MFYSAELLTKNDATFYVVWQYATKHENNIDKREVLNQDVPHLCDSIVKLIPDMHSSIKQNSKKLSLYLLAQLVHGTILVFKRQVEFLQRDGERLIDLMKRSNFIFAKAKEHEKELKRNEKHQKQRSRSRALIRLEEEEERMLENIDNIGDNLGINGRLTDITITDTMPWPNFSNSMEDLPLYGPMDVIQSSGDFLVRTFIDGYPSDATDKSVLGDASDILKPTRKEAEQRKRKKRDDPIFEQPPPENITENINVDVTPLLNQFDNTNFDAFNQPQPDQVSMDIFQSPAFILPITEPEIVPVDPVDQNANQLEKTSSLEKQIEEKIEDNEEPPSKKRKEFEMERIREKSILHRPITPIDRTLLRSTIETPKEPQVEKSFEIDEELVSLIPRKVANKNKNRRVHTDQMQIEHEEMKALRDDYSSLIKTREELILSEPLKCAIPLNELLDPSPYYHLKKRFPKELRSLYRTGRYEDRGTRIREEDELSILDEEEEEDEKLENRVELFLKTLLNSPSPRRTVSEETMPPPPPPPPEMTHLLIEEPPVFMEEVPPLPQQEITQNAPFEESNLEKISTVEALENVRRRHKSSLGVKPIAEGEKLYESEGITTPPEVDTKSRKRDNCVVSSGALFDVRPELGEEIINEAALVYPEWFNFNEFAAKQSRKKAACAFSAVLVALQDRKIEVRQSESFGTIYIQSCVGDVSTLSLEDHSVEDSSQSL